MRNIIRAYKLQRARKVPAALTQGSSERKKTHPPGKEKKRNGKESTPHPKKRTGKEKASTLQASQGMEVSGHTGVWDMQSPFHGLFNIEGNGPAKQEWACTGWQASSHDVYEQGEELWALMYQQGWTVSNVMLPCSLTGQLRQKRECLRLRTCRAAPKGEADYCLVATLTTETNDAITMQDLCTALPPMPLHALGDSLLMPMANALVLAISKCHYAATAIMTAMVPHVVEEEDGVGAVLSSQMS
eukprot:1154472-Pelagomonas_calceolata.AAC.12